MRVGVRQSTVVTLADETPKTRLWTSNLDLLVPRLHLPTIYFFKPDGSSNFFEPEVLKEALSKALVLFYPFAGRLAKDKDGRIEIDCNAEGALFMEAETEATIDDFGDFTPSEKLRQLTPTVDYSTDMSSYPLLLLQVTYFKCGGISIGILLHHMLADGTSAVHFINTWSEIARGHSVSVPPFIDRTILRARATTTPKFQHIEYDAPPSLINHTRIQMQTQETLAKSGAICTSILKITPEQINKLKAHSKKDEITRYSSYEILAAHIWHCMCKARDLSDNQPTKLFVATDGRSRLHPPLPPGYFGNVLFTATVIALSGDILSNPLNHTVERIHAALERMDNEYLRSALDHLEVQPDLTALTRGIQTFRCPNANIVSWRLPLYNADFGWGRPIFVGPANVLFEGTGYIMPNPSKVGSLSLAICLETHHMQLFKQLFYDCT